MYTYFRKFSKIKKLPCCRSTFHYVGTWKLWLITNNTNFVRQMSVCLNRSSKSIHQYIRFVTVVQKRGWGLRRWRETGPFYGRLYGIIKKNRSWKPSKPAERIYLEVYAELSPQTGKRARSPGATNDIHGFCIGWHHGKNPRMWTCGSPFKKGSNIDAIFRQRRFNTDTHKSLCSLTQNVIPKIENKKVGSERVSSAALPWIRSYVAAHLNRIKCTWPRKQLHGSVPEGHISLAE